MCAICGRGGAFHAHHAVFKRLLKGAHLPLHDTRNSRRLCPNCNLAFENRSIKFPLVKLLDQNIEYAFEALGAYAYDWLMHTYDGDDPRLDEHLERCLANV